MCALKGSLNSFTARAGQPGLHIQPPAEHVASTRSGLWGPLPRAAGGLVSRTRALRQVSRGNKCHQGAPAFQLVPVGREKAHGVLSSHKKAGAFPGQSLPPSLRPKRGEGPGRAGGTKGSSRIPIFPLCF